MRLLRKVKSIEVKRCFVISDYLSQQKHLGKRFITKLSKAKRIILGLPETLLDKIIKGGYKKRFEAYNKLDWYIGVVKTDEVGVWKRAGGLRLAWTHNSLKETGDIVAQILDKNPKQLTKRSRMAIPGILKNSLSIIKKEKYLFPIILPGGTMGRKGLKRMKGDIDDGCMRSIALAVSGKKIIQAYIGKKNKLRK